MRAARHRGDRRHGPGRQDHGVEDARAEVVDDLLDRDDRALGGQHRLLLHADDAFEQHVAVAVGALRVDDRRRPAGCAGTAASTSPVKGQVDRADVRVDLRAGRRRDSRGTPRTAGWRRRPRRRWPWRRGSAPRSRAAAASRSRRRRGSGAASRRRDCRPRRRPASSRSPCRSAGRRSGPASCAPASGRLRPWRITSWPAA